MQLVLARVVCGDEGRGARAAGRALEPRRRMLAQQRSARRPESWSFTALPRWSRAGRSCTAAKAVHSGTLT